MTNISKYISIIFSPLFLSVLQPAFANENNGIVVETSSNFDVDLGGSVSGSVNKYLTRFLGEKATVENRLAAEAFLNGMYFSTAAHCHYYPSIKNGRGLKCDIICKRIIDNIGIKGLPQSLLEGELKRKLPIQVGSSIDLNDNFLSSLDIVKARIEAFLKKHGFYGALVEVSWQLGKSAAFVDVMVQIKDGLFAVVNEVNVYGDSPISNRAIKNIYKRMCLSFNKIIESLSGRGFGCYSRELERETTQWLQDKLARMGYIQAGIRISHHWVDPEDDMAKAYCRPKGASTTPRCINLRVDIDKGAKFRWVVKVMDRLAIDRNTFQRFLGSLFSVDQLSRAVVEDGSDELALDQMIVKNELMETITFVSAKNVDEQELSDSAIAITDFLISHGYANAQVNPSISKEDGANVFVTFDVYAGNPYYITSVKILPEQYRSFVGKEELNAMLPIRSITDNGHVSQKKIDSAKEEIQAKLKSFGFNDIDVQGDISATGTGEVEVTFYIKSSERQTVDEVIILNGYHELNDEVLPFLSNCDNYSSDEHHGSTQRKLCHGSSLMSDKIEMDRARIADYYQTNAFLYARVKSELLHGDFGNRIIFTIYDERYENNSLLALKKQAIKDIVISGNSSTKSSVIKRLFPVRKETGILEPISLKRGLSNLRETGRFSRIDHKIFAGEENSDDVYFLLQLTERPSLLLDTSISFSSDQLLKLEAEVEENNLFSSMLKLNTSLSFGLFWGRQSAFSNKIVWPFIWGKPFRLTINAPSIVYDDLLSSYHPMRRLQSKISFNLEWRLNRYVLPYIKYWLVLNQEQKFEENLVPTPSISDRFRTLDGLVPIIQTPAKIRGVLKPGVSYIRLDNPFDPHQGVDLGLWTEVSGGPLLGSPPFINVGTENRFFFPVGAATIALQAIFMRAFIRPTEGNWDELKNGSSMDFLGGDRSVRGYAPRSIGIDRAGAVDSLYAGYLLNTANIEVRFPLTFKNKLGNFMGALFVDQGMVIPCTSLFGCLNSSYISRNHHHPGFGLSLGAALRYMLPVGPISLDYGISPLTGQGRFHLFFGYAF